MAAGKGSRISKKIDGIPKCTLPLLDGTPIIRKSVEMMLELGIEPVLCVGYESEKIKQALQGLNVKYYENPFFAVTNNIASVWFTLPELNGQDDILLLGSDLFYPKSFLEKALTATATLSMFVDSSRIYDGDFYFKTDKEGYIEQYGPQLPLLRRQYEYMGITKLGSSIVSIFAEQVTEYIKQERYQTYFEDIILSFNLEKKYKIEMIDVAGSFWREFDYYEDYELILEYERNKQK